MYEGMTTLGRTIQKKQELEIQHKRESIEMLKYIIYSVLLMSIVECQSLAPFPPPRYTIIEERMKKSIEHVEGNNDIIKHNGVNSSKGGVSNFPTVLNGIK